MDRFDEAKASFEQAIRLSSDFPEAHNNLGALLFHQGKVDEAMVQCQLALKLRPDYAEAHNNLGNALQQQGALEEGLRIFGKPCGLILVIPKPKTTSPRPC